MASLQIAGDCRPACWLLSAGSLGSGLVAGCWLLVEETATVEELVEILLGRQFLEQLKPHNA